MNRPTAMSAWLVLPMAGGALAWFLFGNGPLGVNAAPPPAQGWSLTGPGAPSIAAASQVWEQRHPWGAPPAAQADAEAPEPLAIPVGTAIAKSGRLVAVFLAPDGGLTRYGPGDSIAGGGRVDTVTRFHVAWIDARGTKHEQELLADPLPTPVTQP